MISQAERSTALSAVIAASKLCENVRAELALAASLTKDDRSPVTIADFGAQAVVLETLFQQFPEIPVVAEEDADALRDDSQGEVRKQVLAQVQRVLPEMDEAAVLAAIDRGNYAGGKAGRFWTLDPIDGTKGFLRNDQYAVALALIEDGEVVLGVLGCPALPHTLGRPDDGFGCILVSAKGEGTQIFSAGGERIGEVKVEEVATPAEAAFCESVESGHSRHDRAAQIAEKLGITRPSIRMDSQCKYASIARGDAAIYLRLPTRKGYEEKIWDHAAGVLAVTEAGGTVTDIHGHALDFSQGKTLRLNKGVVATNGCFHEAVVAVVKAVCADMEG